MSENKDDSPQAQRPGRVTTWATLARFIIAGVINTGASYALYWLLLPTMHYQAAYALSFAAGIALSYSLNRRFVFRTSHSGRKLLLFPLTYLASYALGSAVLGAAVWIGVDPRLGPVLSACASIPLTFLLNRRVLADPARSSP